MRKSVLRRINLKALFMGLLIIGSVAAQAQSTRMDTTITYYIGSNGEAGATPETNSNNVLVVPAPRPIQIRAASPTFSPRTNHNPTETPDGQVSKSLSTVSACSITSLTVRNISPCNDNGTAADPSDDYFTSDIQIITLNPPSTGTLELTGDFTFSAGAVGPFEAVTFNFGGFPMRADGTPINITATFSAEPSCTFTNANAGMAPASCSPRCGPGDRYVTICYYGVEQCVSEKIARRYLRLGATIGGCGTGNARMSFENLNEVPLQLSLKAYPNPVQDAVMVEVLSPSAGEGTFEVLDLSGRARQSRREVLVEGRNEVVLRLGTLPSGVYLIRATDAANRQGVVRVSKE